VANTVNGWHFKRGLEEAFMKKLALLAAKGGWFADVLADPGLILGIRNNYLNVYWRGQSLFKIEWSAGKDVPLKISTHPKYLLDPALSKAVPFDGSSFKIDTLTPLIKEYSGAKTLTRMKKAAKLYCGEEKHGVHDVALANPNVIDTEVAFKCDGEEEENPSVPRMDLACLEQVLGSIRLRFWEAKLFVNGELCAEGDKEAQVVGQMRDYRSLVEKHRAEIIQSYRVVAQNLADIARWGDSPRKLGSLIERVAKGEALVIDDVPIVGLIVYGYDDAQGKSKRWKSHLEKLTTDEDTPVRCAGDPKNIKLKHPSRLP
jgi:hypothetical protein